MIYLSEVLKAKITDAADQIVGYLDDILVNTRVDNYPNLEYIVLRDVLGNIVYLSYESIETLGKHGIILKNIFKTEFLKHPKGDFVYLNKDILDQQVIDLEGIKVVRVNDIKFAIINKKMSAVGLDVSFKGILRRLGMEWIDIFELGRVDLIDWKNMQHFKGVLKLNTISSKLEKLHPADFANIIEDMNIKYAAPLISNINNLNEEYATKVIDEIDPNIQKAIINLLDTDKASEIVSNMSADEIVDLLHVFPKGSEKSFLGKIDSHKLKTVANLLSYPDNTAGGLMHHSFILVKPNTSVSKAVKIVKEKYDDFRHIHYLYISDDSGKFLGLVSMRRLLVSNKTDKLGNILKPVEKLTVLHADDKLEKVMEIMTKYDLFIACVLDDDGKLLGLVTIDDVMRCVMPEA